MVQDTELDRSSSKVSPLSKAAKTLDIVTKPLGLSDPWRHKFPIGQAFSSFFHVHHTYTHVDFFLLDNTLKS